MNESSTIINPHIKIKNFSNIRTQYFKRARSENTREETITLPDRGRENADPASGDRAGAGELSCAETVVATEKIATTKRSTKAFAMLTCAIDEGQSTKTNSKAEREQRNRTNQPETETQENYSSGEHLEDVTGLQNEGSIYRRFAREVWTPR